MGIVAALVTAGVKLRGRCFYACFSLDKSSPFQ
jgi:hypothetical protein